MSASSVLARIGIRRKREENVRLFCALWRLETRAKELGVRGVMIPSRVSDPESDFKVFGISVSRFISSKNWNCIGKLPNAKTVLFD